MKSLLLAFSILGSAIGSIHAASTESAMSVIELKNGCEAAIRMSQGRNVTPEERESSIRVMSYIDGYVECLTVLQKMNSELRLIHIPENGRLRIIYVEAVLSTIAGDPNLEKEGTARIAVMIALRKNYSP